MAAVIAVIVIVGLLGLACVVVFYGGADKKTKSDERLMCNNPPSRAVNCPNGHGTMSPVVREDVSAYRCLYCDSTWFDSGRFAQLADNYRRQIDEHDYDWVFWMLIGVVIGMIVF